MESIEITPDGTVRLYLDPLKTYKACRTVGHLNHETDTFTTVRNDNNGTMKNRSQVGFNYELMRSGNFRHIIVQFRPSGRIYRTERQTVLDYGEVLRFQRNKLDLQIYLKLSDFLKPPKPSITPVRPPVIQGNLFEANGNSSEDRSQ